VFFNLFFPPLFFLFVPSSDVYQSSLFFDSTLRLTLARVKGVSCRFEKTCSVVPPTPQNLVSFFVFGDPTSSALFAASPTFPLPLFFGFFPRRERSPLDFPSPPKTSPLNARRVFPWSPPCDGSFFTFFFQEADLPT